MFSMSQEKNSILKDDFYSMIQMQRVKVDDEYKLLLQKHRYHEIGIQCFLVHVVFPLLICHLFANNRDFYYRYLMLH